MKRICCLLFSLCVLAFDIYAQTAVPDVNFELALIELGYDTGPADGYVPTTNISSVTRLDIYDKGISDLTGIEDFVSLEQLICSVNSIAELDLSNNTDLFLLACNNNNLTNLDLTANVNLETLNCSYNELVNLNVEGLSLLATVYCDYNNLGILDFSTNTALVRLNCSNNNLRILNVHNGNNAILLYFSSWGNPELSCIEVDDANAANTDQEPYVYWAQGSTAVYSEDCVIATTYVPDDNFEQALIDLGHDVGPLDDYVTTWNLLSIPTLDLSGLGIVDLTGIEACESLTELDCSDNSIVILDLSQNTALTNLNCSNNMIEDLDLSQHTALTSLDCTNNSLSTLNVRNGSNYLLSTFNSSSNASLTCIEVDNEIKAIRGEAPYDSWLKDAASGYSSDCDLYGQVVYIPDDHFEQALIDLDYDAVLDDYASASMISAIEYLSINSELIADLTGIEGFTSLRGLEVNNNLLTSLDVSQNILLESLECYTNFLTTLDLSNNTALTNLNCTNNEFQSLDVSVCPDLVNLNCQNNQLTELIFNSALAELNVRKNQLQSLDFSNNANLASLDCFDNQLTSLDLSSNPLLGYLDCGNNNISSLVIDGTSLYNLKCPFNSLTSLDLGDLTTLLRLDCRHNQLTSLNLGNNPDLWLLTSGYNQLSSLDLSTSTGLIDFTCNNNQLTTLDVSNNILLGSIYCENNQLTSITFGANPDLLTLKCNNNQITSLDLSAFLKLSYINVSDNPLTSYIGPGGARKSVTDVNDPATDLLYLKLARTNLTWVDVSGYTALDSLVVTGSLLDSLDVSNNVDLRILEATNLPLGCIQVNQNQYDDIPEGWTKDPDTGYSTDCSSYTFIEVGMQSSMIRVYPNPVSDYLVVESEVPILTARIFSIRGSKLMDINSDFNSLPVNQLPTGIYLLHIESEEGDAIIRFIKR